MIEREPIPQEEKERKPTVKEQFLDRLGKSRWGKILILALGPTFLASGLPKAFAGEEPTPPAPTAPAEQLSEAQKEILKIDADRVALKTQMIREFIPSQVTVETTETPEGETISREKIDTNVDSTKTLREVIETKETDKTAQEQLTETVNAFKESLGTLGLDETTTKELMRKLAFDIQNISTKINPDTSWADAEQVLFGLERMTRKGGEKIGLTAEQTQSVVDAEKQAIVGIAGISTRMQIGFENESSAPTQETTTEAESETGTEK